MSPRGSTVVGRSQELGTLGRALDGVTRGPVPPLLLIGEAGMGKSALLDALARLARGRRLKVVRTQSPSGAQAHPFTLVEDLARALADCLALLQADDAEVLRTASRDGAARSGRIAAALLELLSEASHQGPVLMLLDDLHWADEGSLSALVLAMGRLQTERVALVAAARPRPVPDLPLMAWDAVDVGPLDPDAAASLLRRHLEREGGNPVLDDPAADDQLRIIAERLGRCPLALVEAGRLLTPSQLAGIEPLPEPLPITDRLQAAWGRAWAALPATAGTAMLALCVTMASGPELLGPVLADVHLTPDALDPARSDRLVVGAPDRLALAHPLVRDAVLTQAGSAAVRDLNRRAARCAQALGLAPSIVAAHIAAGALPGDESAIASLVALAEDALAADLGDPAVSALLAAAQLTRDAAGRARLAARAAEVQMIRSLSSASIDGILRLAEPGCLTAEQRFWVEWMRSEWLVERDVRQSMVALASTAERAAEIDSPMLPWIEYSAITNAWEVGDGPAALHHARALRDLADRADADSDGRMPPWACRAMHALTLFQIGRVRAAHEELERAREQARRWRPTGPMELAQRIQALVVDMQTHDLDPSVDARLDALARLLARDPGQTLGQVRALQARRALRRGDTALARAMLDEALDLDRGSTARSGRLILLTGSVLIAAVRGDRARLRQDAALLRATAQQMGLESYSTRADRAEGLAALAEGQLDVALLRLEPLLHWPLLGRGPWDAVPMGRADLVEALVRAGSAARAADVAADLVATLGPSPDPFARGLVHRVEGLTSHGGPARSALLDSVAAFAAAGDPIEEARSRLLLGELLRRERSIDDARQELRLAAAAFEATGAAAWRTRALGELRATRAAVPASAVDPWAELTPQERRVALAVAAGGSNRQVAAELFLSARTVGYHLASIYRKLGISSRTALAARLAQAERGAPAGQAGPG